MNRRLVLKLADPLLVVLGIRDACAASIFDHAGTLTGDIAEAMKKHRIAGAWTNYPPPATS